MFELKSDHCFSEILVREEKKIISELDWTPKWEGSSL